MMRRILTALGIGAASVGAVSAEDGFYGKYETPRYEVVQQIGAAEVRAYAPYVAAEVAMCGTPNRARINGFRALAGYIFGGNEGNIIVDMTSPVMQTSTQLDLAYSSVELIMSCVVNEGDPWNVQFPMPRSYTIDTLPAPDNAAVRFVEIPARSMLVVGFSDHEPSRVLETRSTQIIEIAQRAGLNTAGAPVFMFYDDPFTLPFNRRNEVALEVR